jgi:hypothetical protein
MMETHDLRIFVLRVSVSQLCLSHVVNVRPRGGASIVMRCSPTATSSKHLFVIEVLLDEEEPTHEDPIISLHALTGIQSRSARTM